MSKTIEWDGTQEGLADLDDDDLKYLHDRNRITDEQWAMARDFDEDDLQPSTDLSQPPPVEETANTGDANTAGLTKAQHEHRQKRMAKEQADDRVSDSEAIVAPGDYADAKNDDLRAEIARRNEDRDEDDQLPLTGNKAALIAVLEEDDAADEDEE